MADIRNLKYTLHKYGDHELQRIGVWTWARPSGAQHSVPGDPYASTTKYWLVYIHGGIWRDPRKTHLQALPAFSILGGNSGNQARIAGFASIDYRLSPHPEFPQDEDTTPPNKLRNAKHPDHLSDVRSALAFLRREYGIGNREVEGETPYVLYGHSCGATLAMQVIMGGAEDEVGLEGRGEVPPPAGVVGLQGMYDLVGVNARFKGAYRDMIAGAFGDDEEVWKSVSPARFKGKFSQTWEGSEKGVVVLAHSPEDEWVDMAELDAMEARLKGEKDPAPLHVQAKRDLKGDHDEVAQNGGMVAGVLIETVGLLDMVAKLTKMTEEMLGLR
ncbi:Alpha/Beta hydrolase protein [Coniochaeta sp. 2T2.1]|nr:Alpha/Beta hydrolase protein [Coniochaeta sp. 2T2.1]